MFPYMGGKAFHIKHLDRIFPVLGYDRFVDVFGGAGWVSVKSNLAGRCEQVYNDANPHLANIFRWLSQDPDAVLAYLTAWPQQDAVLYRQFQQDIFGSNPEPAVTAETAAKYLYLEVQSFSGNTLGLKSSVYFDKIHTLNPLIRKLQNPRILQRLARLTTTNLDCLEVIRQYDSPTTFFYCDPPYFKLEHYYTHGFGRDQHQQLAQTLKACSGGWAVSYYDFEELHDWFPEDQYRWHTYSVSKQSSSRNNKQRGQEVVIVNA